MARVMQTKTTILLEVPVEYRGTIPLDERRLRWLEKEMQEATLRVESTLRCLRFTGEPE